MITTTMQMANFLVVPSIAKSIPSLASSNDQSIKLHFLSVVEASFFQSVSLSPFSVLST